MEDMDARAAAIQDFASVLRELRSAMGNPPFREMSGRSGAISHTTLYDATKGNRLPSWETTVEFIKACGGDPTEYRERWERANRTVRGRGGDAAARPPSPEGPAEPPALPSARPNRGRPRLSLLTKAALGAAAVGGGVLAVVALSGDRGAGADKHDARPLSGLTATVPGPADCPVLTPNPPPAPPAHAGDLAVFVADETLIDCARVRPGATVTKVWRLQNAGTVPWNGYSMHRLDSPQQVGRCQTIAEIPIEDTPPGQAVDISADVTAQKTPGLCYMLFKLVDAQGRIAFPGTRPVNFQIIIDPQAPAVQDTARARLRPPQVPSTMPE